MFRHSLRFWIIMVVLLVLLSACTGSGVTATTSYQNDFQNTPEESPYKDVSHIENPNPSPYNDIPMSAEETIIRSIENVEETVTVNGFSIEEANALFENVYYHHPEFFWLDGSSGYKSDGSSVKIKIGYNQAVHDLDRYQAVFKTAVSNILSVVGPWTDYDKALFLHDYLVEMTAYDETAAEYIETAETPRCTNMSNTAYGCLVDHTAICSGYSMAYQLLLRCEGIVSGPVLGGALQDSSTTHEWNYAVLDGNAYQIDVTWDDPVSSDGEPSE